MNSAKNFLVDFLAIFIVVGFFALVFIVAFTSMDKADHDILYLLTGQLSGAFLLVVSYYFGSSNTEKKETNDRMESKKSAKSML